LVALFDCNILDPTRTIVVRNVYNPMFVIFFIEWILDGEIHFANTWLVAKVVEALKNNEQSAGDGYEIKETKTFVANLEEKDGNTHDVSATVSLTD
jgi:hypothetical protein